MHNGIKYLPLPEKRQAYMDNLWKYLILIGVLILFSRRKKGKAKDASAPPKPELEEPWSDLEMEMTTDDDAQRTPQLPRGWIADTPQPSSQSSSQPSPNAYSPSLSSSASPLASPAQENAIGDPYVVSAARSGSSGTRHNGLQTCQSGPFKPVATSSPQPILQAGDVDGMRRAFLLSEIFHRKY